jgi:hypothetical protein
MLCATFSIRYRLCVIVMILFGLIFLSFAGVVAQSAWLDRNREIEERVNALVGKMMPGAPSGEVKEDGAQQAGSSTASNRDPGSDPEPTSK